MLFKKFKASTIVALGVTAYPAIAQDIPFIDGVGAFHHSQVMRHRERPDLKQSKDSDPQNDARDRLMALSPQSRKSLLALQPELKRRMRVDGAATANQWFESKVVEAERREGLRP